MSVGARVDPGPCQERTNPQSMPEALSQPSTPEYTLPPNQCNPSHSVFTKCDKCVKYFFIYCLHLSIGFLYMVGFFKYIIF